MKNLLYVLTIGVLIMIVASSCEKEDEKNAYTCNYNSATGLYEYSLGNLGRGQKTTYQIYTKFYLSEKYDTAGLIKFEDVNQSEDIAVVETNLLQRDRSFLSSDTTEAIIAKVKGKLKGVISFEKPAKSTVGVYIFFSDVVGGNFGYFISKAFFAEEQETTCVYDFDLNFEQVANITHKSQYVVHINIASSTLKATNAKLVIEKTKDYNNIEVEYAGGRAGYVVGCGCR
jgi:hypothetical protein